MEFIDLRSDTVTVPTPEMRQAMFDAKVGDDVYGEDPTVIELQLLAAQMLKKQAALFVPSGTFGNQCCILTWTRPGTEFIISNDAHIVSSEGGAAGLISNVQMRCVNVKDSDGMLTAEKVQELIRVDDSILTPTTTLVSVEQPTLQGKVYSLEALKEIYQTAKSQGVAVHMDGARIFNAATYLKCEAWEIAQYADSIMFCLSKGLCAPVGSLILGSSIFISSALSARKLLGGGMRQVGVIAAPGLLSLTKQIKYLEEDHQMAQLLANKLKKIPQIKVLDQNIQINMLHISIESLVSFEDLKEFMLERKIKLKDMQKGVIKLMTHFYIREEQVTQVVKAFKKYFKDESE